MASAPMHCLSGLWTKKKRAKKVRERERQKKSKSHHSFPEAGRFRRGNCDCNKILLLHKSILCKNTRSCHKDSRFGGRGRPRVKKTARHKKLT
jgi:hypothetical protein